MYSWTTAPRWRRPKMSIRSIHSRRTVPTKRSAKALARGARTGVRMIRIPSEAEDFVETQGELGVSVPDQKLDRKYSFGEHHAQVPGLLGDPRTTRTGGDPGHVDPAGVEFDEEQHVEALQQHCVHREEIAGQHGRCLSGNELGPSGTRPHR